MHLGGNRRWVSLCHFPEESLKINRFTCKVGDPRVASAGVYCIFLTKETMKYLPAG